MQILNYKIGDTIIIQDINAIKATLDYLGCNGEVYFSPEMEKFCGKEFKLTKKWSRKGVTTWKADIGNIGITGTNWSWSQNWFDAPAFLTDDDFEV